MKKIIFILSLALLFASQSVFAAVFNTAGNDCPTVTVSNVTTGAGTNTNVNGCEYGSSVQSSGGDEIAVSIYYHNTSSSPATNVRVSLTKNPSSGSASNHSFYATINSDQGNISGSGQVQINSSSSLNFSHAVWQPNQSRSNANFPSGQTGSQVMSGGVNIGTINPGWNTQGYVIAYFNVDSTVVYNPPYNPPYYPPYNPPQGNCQIDNFRVSDDYIDEGDRVTFYWNTTNCSYVTLTDFNGQMDVDDSRNAYPDYSGNYCLRAYGNGNDQECIYIDVDEYRNRNSNLEVETNNATSIGNTYATLNGFIDPDDSYATRWFRYGTRSSSLAERTNEVNHGYNSSNFSAYIGGLRENTTYYFQAVGENNDGDIEYGKIKNFNTNAIVVNNNNMSAVTTVATGVTQSSAILNGLISNPENTYTSAYFEYGKSIGLGARTASKALGTSASPSSFDSISGLSTNTIYYYRIVGENTNGKSYGDIKFFQTLANNVVPPVNPGTPQVQAKALASIDIENRYELVRTNDVIDYTIVYKNTGKTKLENSVLQIFLPDSVAYTNSSRGNYDERNNQLFVYLEDLSSGQDGVVYVQGKVVRLPANNSQIVTTAMLVYTNEKGSQENVMDNVFNRAGESVNTNLASAAFFAWFGSLSLCFWLFLIILILLAILFSRNYRRDREERARNINPHIN